MYCFYLRCLGFGGSGCDVQHGFKSLEGHKKPVATADDGKLAIIGHLVSQGAAYAEHHTGLLNCDSFPFYVQIILL
jgi:hypothetical protein